MQDFEQARVNMVDCQIRPNDVTSHPILAAFGSVPREKFVAASMRPLAYIDEDLKLSEADSQRFLMEPMSMARLIQLAEIDSDDIVLDIGCATGYSTAILSQLCNSVVAVESDAQLCEQATETLVALNYDNTVVINGPLGQGCAKEGPYDAIFVGGAVGDTPQALGQQLKEGGRMVVVEGVGNSAVAKVYLREGDRLQERKAFNCAVKALPGFEREEEFVF